MPIRVLDAATVGRIAAGEVVERPSSVVKELIENSLDAGATSITVEIKGGGLDYLRVTDNGCGIEPNQVRIAFQNHATSKLTCAEQLEEINTLGFRGEALPSIASVSHLEMSTCIHGAEMGVRVTIDGGEDMRVQEAGCPAGTTIVIHDLFYNIPVRKTFLQKPLYEAGLVQDVVARMILGHPEVSFRFINNGNGIYNGIGDGLLRHAVFTVYGKETAESMIELDAAEGSVRAYGLIGVGEQAKATRAHEAFFINGRAVRSVTLTRALEEACITRVTVGLYPMCVLNLVVPPSSINVNVHPTKTEVRFKDDISMRETAEYLFRKAFVKEHVLQFEQPAVKAPPPMKPEKIAQPIPAKEPEPSKAVKSETANEVPKDAPKPPTRTPADAEGRDMAKAIRYQDSVDAEMQKLIDRRALEALHETPDMLGYRQMERDQYTPTYRLGQGAVAEAYSESITGDVPVYRVIGVLMNTYILIEANDSLMMIDQHAAHERLNYERLKTRLEDGRGSQRLLTPVVVHLSAREMALIQDNLDVLRDSGYEVEPFGAQDIQLRAVPFILGKSEARPAFMNTVNALSRLRQATDDLRRAEIIQMSCKAAVKGGEALTQNEIESLIKQMLETGAPPTCPHGRPVMKAISRTELEKMFKRIQ